VITKPGEYMLFNGKLTLRVSEENGELSTKIIFSPKKSVTFSGPAEKRRFWLVYPESATKFWFFQEPNLSRYEETEHGSHSVRWGPDGVMKNAPKAVLDALPKAVLDKLKGK
jgi:hypothetical protein